MWKKKKEIKWVKGQEKKRRNKELWKKINRERIQEQEKGGEKKCCRRR